MSQDAHDIINIASYHDVVPFLEIYRAGVAPPPETTDKTDSVYIYPDRFTVDRFEFHISVHDCPALRIAGGSLSLSVLRNSQG